MLYIASQLENYQLVIDLINRFSERGISITFDWATLWERQLTEQLKVDKKDIAEQMLEGVKQAKTLLLICPGKRGAHVELGMAIALGKKVVIFCPDKDHMISFYNLGTIVTNIDEAVDLCST
jgi:nucleoside 2-deoxyribosyltransferase